MEDGSQLMVRVAQRDARAFEQLYDAFNRLVHGIAVRMLGDATAAEDLTQAVFLKIWSSPETFRGGNFGAWIARVARNRALDMLRSRATRSESEMPADLAEEESLDDVVFARIDGKQVRSALMALPQEQRTLIEMGFFGGVTHEEIARRTATPLGTVKTRIRSGLRKLRSELEGTVRA